MTIKSKLFALLAAGLILGSGSLASASSTTKVCTSTVTLNPQYLPYDDETGPNWNPDFSQCPQTVTYDYHKMNHLGECIATVNDVVVKIHYSFGIWDSDTNTTLHAGEKQWQSGIWIEMVSEGGHPYAGGDENFATIVLDSSVNHVRFEHSVSPGRHSGNGSKTVYQFYFEPDVIDNGCTEMSAVKPLDSEPSEKS